MTAVVDEWEALRIELARADVAGAGDLGRFVSNVEFFGASEFDERAAMPVLLKALPGLTDARLVSAVAGHLRRPWARPTAFGPLLVAFRYWAEKDSLTGWALGDALGTAATIGTVGELLDVCEDRAYGTARQMPVMALGRFKKLPEVGEALLRLIHDPDVGMHAMSALRRVLGSPQALTHIEAVERAHRGERLRDQAGRLARKVRRSLGSTGG